MDAATGKEVWKARLGDINLGETFTMAPLVVRGKVLVGNSGGEFGVRGWLAALDADTGKILWRAYATGPDRDVLIGPNFKPYYEQDRGKDLGMKTWQGGQWKIGGGAGWSWISYDPGLDLIYYGTSNPGPWNAEQRPGDNKWTCTLFARKPDTGEAIWAYQINPHDDHDYDGVNENILLDLTIQGPPRKVLAHPDRNARMYIIDRVTGEVLSAEPFTNQNTSESVDLKTGKIKYAASKATGFKTVRDICPASPGGKDWQPSSYSPHTGLIYIPHNNLCMEYEGVQANYIAGTPFVGANVRMYPGPGGNRGAVSAWDPKTIEGIVAMGSHEAAQSAVEVSALSNGQIADRLAGLAQLLSTQKENPYKVKAYHRAAVRIRSLSEGLDELVREDADLTQFSAACQQKRNGQSRRYRERVKSRKPPDPEAVNETARVITTEHFFRPFLRPPRLLRELRTPTAKSLTTLLLA